MTQRPVLLAYSLGTGLVSSSDEEVLLELNAM